MNRLKLYSKSDIDRMEVFDSCNWTCGICGNTIEKTLRVPDYGAATLDHIIPLSKGGKHERSNVTAAHLGCNERKGDLTMEEVKSSYAVLQKAPSAITVYKWKTVEDVMAKLQKRNKKYRIIDGTMYIKVSGTDPLMAWDCTQKKYVYLSKADWLRGSPALRRTDACVIIRMIPHQFHEKSRLLGIFGHRGSPGKQELPRTYPNVFYSIEDCIEIIRNTNSTKIASEKEIRQLFSKGYITYKRTQSGEFIPVWSETI